MTCITYAVQIIIVIALGLCTGALFKIASELTLLRKELQRSVEPPV